MFNLVFFEPEIPQNTGAAGRLCLATGSTLHLIKPLGFSLDDKAVRRAGLDYWKEVPLKVWDSLPDLQAAHPDSRFWLLSTKASRTHWDTSFQEGDFFIFGPESRGLPESLLSEHPDETLKIPMQVSSTRSLNVATSAAIVLYEAWRQIQ
ncbi:MAG: tRNA (cytidine(34)-2'-O)-methyltransferase [Akkermansiaceae bacterium]|jgi:tRNA (cytidine/uridine-2'-O-)-methyltransferase|nr:tRNA (cytidine(34)-2'-O)-methyltransferase [Akkermansiaceae bacterium]|tara:strand:- start:439 stop:888 length:450 start_codon:yes stop_codon:yes gene_type:complete